MIAPAKKTVISQYGFHIRQCCLLVLYRCLFLIKKISEQSLHLLITVDMATVWQEWMPKISGVFRNFFFRLLRRGDARMCGFRFGRVVLSQSISVRGTVSAVVGRGVFLIRPVSSAKNKTKEFLRVPETVPWYGFSALCYQERGDEILRRFER